MDRTQELTRLSNRINNNHSHAACAHILPTKRGHTACNVNRNVHRGDVPMSMMNGVRGRAQYVYEEDEDVWYVYTKHTHTNVYAYCVLRMYRVYDTYGM